MLTFILIGIIAALLVAVIILIATRPKVYVLSDKLPKDASLRYGALKLQNEIKPFLYQKDDRVYLRVVRKK